MQIKETMNKNIVKVGRATSLRQLLNLFSTFHTLPVIPVVDKNNLLIGLVSLSSLLDILRPQPTQLLKNLPFVEVDESSFDWEKNSSMGDLVLVDDIMETEFIYIEEDISLEEAYRLMQLHHLEQIPVVDKNKKILGIIGIFDIVLAIFRAKEII
jgi:Mg/Co/Ni transporter MgtE